MTRSRLEPLTCAPIGVRGCAACNSRLRVPHIDMVEKGGFRMSDDEETVRQDAARQGGHLDPLGSNSEIGRKLKQFYDGIVSDQVPDRFMDLLSKLEAADSSRKKD